MSAFAAAPVRRPARWSRAGVVAAGLAAALAFGAVVAVHPYAALALLALTVFLAAVILDLPLAVGLLVSLTFVNQVAFFNRSRTPCSRWSAWSRSGLSLTCADPV